MIFIENPNTDPYQNHALEEWLMDAIDDDCFMLWRNQKSILLGKNQNAYSEVDMPYMSEHNIKLVRRITGGGAVFTDEGNIMFTFISCNGKKDFSDFKRFTEPILKVLNRMGIPAEFSGRNDLLIDGRKFSGNAQCRYKDKLLHHGTLMYQANTEELEQALRVKDIKLKSKGIASVKSRVTNISEHMEKVMDIEAFRSFLFQAVMEETEHAKLYTLTPEQWRQVKALSIAKYASKEWIYGQSPAFQIKKETKYAGGIIEIFLEIEKGKITDVKIYGDFFGTADIANIEEALKGIPYDKISVMEKLICFEIKEYFGEIVIEELVSAFF